MTDPDTGHLIGAMTDIQAQQVVRIIKDAGQPVTYLSLPDAAHTMYDPDPKRFAQTVIDWIGTLTWADGRVVRSGWAVT